MQNLHLAAFRSNDFAIRELDASDSSRLTVYHQVPEVLRFRKWTYRKSHERDALVAAELESARTFPKRHGVVLGFEHKGTRQLLCDGVLAIEPHDKRQVELDLTLPHNGVTFRPLLRKVLHEFLRHQFLNLRKHRVKLPAHVDNVELNELCRELGMRHEGRLRENACYQGEWADENLYALLAREWN